MGDPSARWDMMARGKDSINLNDPEHSRIRGFMERMGTPIPANGIVTKQDYIAESTKRMASFSGGMGGQPGGVATTFSGSMGNGGRMSFGAPGGGDRGQDRDGGGGRDRNSAMASLSGGGDGNSWGSWGGGGGGGSGAWGNRQDSSKEAQDEKPFAIRYGHLPKGLPEWFEEYDSNKDGQVALHEWRKGGESVESFSSYDLNGDGLITADELLRHDRNQAEAQRVAAIMDGSGGSTRTSFAGGSSARGTGASGMRNFGMRGPRGASPGDTPAAGIALPGSTPDSGAASSERGPAWGRKRDGEKTADASEKSEKADQSEKSDKSESTPGNNGRWGSGGKKSKG